MIKNVMFRKADENEVLVSYTISTDDKVTPISKTMVNNKSSVKIASII